MTADAFTEIEQAAACQAEFVELYRQFLPNCGTHWIAYPLARSIEATYQRWRRILGDTAYTLKLEALRIVRAEMAGEELT